MSRTAYEIDVQNRTVLRYYLGAFARFKKYLLYSYARNVAKRRGAKIGENTVLPLTLARRATSNLEIGNNSSVQSDLIDLRAPVKIGNNVIIGSGVEIITCSHQIDSSEWEFKPYGIEIEDFAWIATRVLILPSCRKISRGAVCGAGSLVTRNVDQMSVVSGSPASHLKFRKQVHSKLVVESLLGGDFTRYIKTWNLKR
ncbi:acyltransferase [Flavihumibacter sp. R14]|nr:acyltransferase [Flavihumibacter soli]